MKMQLLFLFFAISSGVLAQQKKSSNIEVLNFKSAFITFFTNGEKDDFGQEIKIAFFKDYILFETPTYHHKAQTAYIDFDNIKDGDTIEDHSEPDMTIEKITYSYYIFKNGYKNGLFYDRDGKVKYFSVDTLFEQSNLGKSNEEFLGRDIGGPKETRKLGKRIFEKYYGFKKEQGVDTIFRHYDEAMKGINFSISKKLDQEKQSKLVKSLAVINHKHSLDVNTLQPLRTEMIDEIILVTRKVPKAQIEKYEKYFAKYQQDIIKLPIKN